MCPEPRRTGSRVGLVLLSLGLGVLGCAAPRPLALATVPRRSPVLDWQELRVNGLLLPAPAGGRAVPGDAPGSVVITYAGASLVASTSAGGRLPPDDELAGYLDTLAVVTLQDTGRRLPGRGLEVATYLDAEAKVACRLKRLDDEREVFATCAAFGARSGGVLTLAGSVEFFARAGGLRMLADQAPRVRVQP